MSDPLTINGSFLREVRESLGWSHGEVASRACLSVKQVKQLEEGGASSFYSDNVKLTAARKVAGILGVSENDLLGKAEPEVAQLAEDITQALDSSPASLSASATADAAHYDKLSPHSDNTESEETESIAHPDFAENAKSTSTQIHQPILTPGVQALTIRSEVLHFLAQPPEEGHDEHHLGEETGEAHRLEKSSDQTDSEHQLTSESSLAHPSFEHSDASSENGELSAQSLDHEITKTDSAQVSETDKDQASSNSASNLLKIIVLFLLALGIAAFFAQKTNEEHSEPPPPLQAVPDATTQGGSDPSVKQDDQPSSAKSGTPAVPSTTVTPTPTPTPTPANGATFAPGSSSVSAGNSAAASKSSNINSSNTTNPINATAPLKSPNADQRSSTPPSSLTTSTPSNSSPGN